MSVTYTNRRGQIYYLHQKQDNAGKTQCYFSLKSTGSLATSVPEGFEIYEHPSGKVYCRRIPRRIVDLEEKAVIERGVKAYTDLPSYLIEVEKNMIVVYTPNVDFADFGNLLGNASRAMHTEYRQKMTRFLDYEASMRFVLVDKKERSFVAQRYCYRGSIDDWIDISFPGELADLAREYLRHLGKDSYFDLYLH